MSESTNLFLGNAALAQVLKQFQYVTNKPSHQLAVGKTKEQRSLLLRQGASVRAQAKAMAEEPDRLAMPSGVAPPKGYMGMYELFMSKRPISGIAGRWRSSPIG